VPDEVGFALSFWAPMLQISSLSMKTVRRERTFRKTSGLINTS
jgi:hypothetical protein